MGKNHRHKKLLKSEKAKVKLKGKKLTKAANVTDTNFKIKKIVINKQLESNDSDEWTTKRNLNLQDLLTRIRHYNVSTRKDALGGIYELINWYTAELLEKNLNQVLENVLKLTIDVEKPVRKESFRVLKKLFTSVPVNKLKPHYDLITSYLCCSMTHINHHIQEDSLIFIDLLIESSIELLAQYFMKIIPSFLDLISKMNNDSKLDRKLTLKLNSKQTTVKWRVNVLNRLEHLLKAIGSDMAIKKFVKKSVVKFDPLKENYFPIYNTSYQETCSLNFFNKKLTEKEDNEKLILQNCITGIVPILFDAWLESKPPDDGGFKLEAVLKEEQSEVLRSVLVILNSILLLTERYEEKVGDKILKIDFLTKYCEQFVRHFIEKFPYVHSDSKNVNRPCWEQNLHIVLLFLNFSSIGRNNKYILDHKTVIFDYLNKCLVHINKLNQQSELLVGNILKTSFTVKCNNIYAKEIHRLLDQVVDHFNKQIFSGDFKSQIFEILCSIVFNHSLFRTDNYQRFLQTLPELLAKDDNISIATWKLVVKLCCQNNQFLLEGIKKHLKEIITNLENMQLNMIPQDSETTPYEILTQILFYINK